MGGTITRTFTYDAAGNVISDNRAGDGLYTYVNNHANRLESVSKDGALLMSYIYNYLGQMVQKTPPSGTIIKIVHDMYGNRIAEYSVAQTAGATPVLLREYIWMDDMLVAVVEQEGSQYGTVYAIRTDHIGRPVFATDAAGTKVWEVQYLRFGGVQTVVGAPIDLGFPGQWFQTESGLYQNWMRDYDATTGSYLQPDPLGLVDGPNVYRYAMANPMRYVDPRGEAARTLLPDELPPVASVENGDGCGEDVAGVISWCKGLVAGAHLLACISGQGDGPGQPTPRLPPRDPPRIIQIDPPAVGSK